MEREREIKRERERGGYIGIVETEVLFEAFIIIIILISKITRKWYSEYIHLQQGEGNEGRKPGKEARNKGRKLIQARRQQRKEMRERKEARQGGNN